MLARVDRSGGQVVREVDDQEGHEDDGQDRGIDGEGQGWHPFGCRHLGEKHALKAENQAKNSLNHCGRDILRPLHLHGKDAAHLDPEGARAEMASGVVVS